MSKFSVIDNMPEAYVNGSRDFQLMCHLMDILNGSVQHDAGSILSILNTNECPDKLLPYLKTKLGFFENNYIDSKTIRNILAAFVDLMRDKGSIRGIFQAVSLYIKTLHLTEGYAVKIYRYQRVGGADSYIIRIELSPDVVDVELLNTLLQYVKPAGMKIKFVSDGSYVNKITKVSSQDKLHILFTENSDNSTLYGTDSEINYDEFTTIVPDGYDFTEITNDMVAGDGLSLSAIGTTSLYES